MHTITKRVTLVINSTLRPDNILCLKINILSAAAILGRQLSCLG